MVHAILLFILLKEKHVYFEASEVHHNTHKAQHVNKKYTYIHLDVTTNAVIQMFVLYLKL